MNEVPVGIQTAVEKQEYLFFSINSIEFGVDIRVVKEIIKIQPISAVPNSLGFCRGIINIRGTITPVVDMRSRLGFGPGNYDERACIIVIMLGSELVGIIVDMVRDVINFSEEELTDASSFSSLGEGKKYTSKIAEADGKIKQILDIYSVLDIECQ